MHGQTTKIIIKENKMELQEILRTRDDEKKEKEIRQRTNEIMGGRGIIFGDSNTGNPGSWAGCREKAIIEIEGK